jgi:5-methylcytosine-specific restriction endonuclease McrA
VELADGGSFSDWANLRATCVDCHKKKTAENRTARAKRKKEIASKTPDPPNPVLQE